MMDAPGVWKQKSHGSKEDSSASVSIAKPSAWGSLKSDVAQKPSTPTSNAVGWPAADRDLTSKLSVTDCWSAGAGSQMNGTVNQWNTSPSVPCNRTDAAWSGSVDCRTTATGWGSPDLNPNPNAGTENWTQQSSLSLSSSASAWNTDSTRSSVWGSDQKPSSNAPGWGMPEGKGSSIWCQSSTQQETSTAWNSLHNESGGNSGSFQVSNVEVPQSNWEGCSIPSSQNSKCDTSWSTGQTTSSEIQPPSGPGTWAQAAGRGLVTSNKPTGTSSANSTQPTRDEIIARAINCHEGWGKTPIRQDTSWDISSSDLVPGSSSAVKPAPLVEEVPVKQCITNTNGTAIWEASKDSSVTPSGIPAGHPISVGLVLTSTNCSNTKCGEPNATSGWGFPRAVGDRNVQLPVHQPSSSANTSPWNVSYDQSVPAAGGNIWNSSSSNNAAGKGWKEETCDKPIVPPENSSTCGNSELVLGVDIGHQSPSDSCWSQSGAGFVQNSAGTTASNSTPWANGILSGSSVSQSSATTTLPTSVKLGSSDNIWSQPIAKTSNSSSSSTVSWGDAATESIWNPLPSCISSNWSEDASWPVTNLKSNVWSGKSDVDLAAEDKKLDDAPFSVQGTNLNLETTTGSDLVQNGAQDISEQSVSLVGDVNVAAAAARLLQNASASGGGSGALDALASSVVIGSSPTVVSTVDNLDVRPFTATLPSNFSIPPPSVASVPVVAASLQHQNRLQSSQQLMMQHLQSATGPGSSRLPSNTTLAGPSPGTVGGGGSTPTAPPSPALIIAIQQLLQLQQMLHRLQLQQAATFNHPNKLTRPPPSATDPLTITMAKIRQQIGTLQLQIQAYRQQLFQQQQHPGSQLSSFDPTNHDILGEFANMLQIRDDAATAAGLGLCKPSSPPDLASLLPPNRFTGTEASQMLSGFISHPVNGWPGGWPGSVSNRSGGTIGDGMSEAAGAGAASLGDMQALAAIGGAGGSTAAASLDIEEFIPGKPWQGPTVKRAEDDPFVTPGSVARRVFNLGAVDDMHVMNVLGNGGKTSPNPITSAGKPSAWLPEPQPSGTAAAWPRGSNSGTGSGGVDMFGVTNAKNPLQRTPPGLNVPPVHWQQPSPQTAFGRSSSWAPKSSYDKSNSILIKNLPVQIDATIIKMLCQQHGTVQYFNHSPTGRLAIVTFTRPDDAVKAQHALNGYIIANTQLASDLIADNEVCQLAGLVGSDQSSSSLANIWSMPAASGSPQSAWPAGPPPSVAGAPPSVATAANPLWNVSGGGN